jgi:hypothetical protein
LQQKQFAPSIEGGENPENGRISSAGLGTVYITSVVSIASIPTRRWSEEFMGSVWTAGKKDPEYRKVLEGLEQEAALARPGLDGSNTEEEAALPREEQWTGWMVRSEKILGIKDGLLYRKGMLWIPEDEGLKRKELASEHDTKVAGHMGQDKTIELVRRNF